MFETSDGCCWVHAKFFPSEVGEDGEIVSLAAALHALSLNLCFPIHSFIYYFLVSFFPFVHNKRLGF